MNIPTMESTTKDPDYHAIETLVVDNADLERLEMLLNQFNMFEAMGAVWQKAIHCNILAFLLNPQQNHGLHDTFLKKLLQRAALLAYEVELPFTPIDLDMWDMRHTIVLQKSQQIDILLIDERHRLAIILNNQLSDKATNAQLHRYWDMVNQSHPGWNIVGLYLTPDGEPPPDERYISINYNLICSLLEGLLDLRADKINSEVAAMLFHYTEMVRRYIVEESEITRLCRRIYGKHQRAFDLIYEHRLSRQKTIRNIIRLLIEQKQGLILDHSQERYIGFALQEWEVPSLTESNNGIHARRSLIFQFDTWFDTLPLGLYITSNSDQVRHRLFDVAIHHQPPFKTDVSQITGREWIKIFERLFLSAEFYEEATTDALADKILNHWTEFLKQDLPAIQTMIESQEWFKRGR